MLINFVIFEKSINFADNYCAAEQRIDVKTHEMHLPKDRLRCVLHKRCTKKTEHDAQIKNNAVHNVNRL